MIKWENIGKEVRQNGEGTTYYTSKDGRFTIEGRRRAIRRANGTGYWMYTSYFLIDGNDNSEKEYATLKKAKEAAEVKV